jgi:hypothetical protein
LTHFDCMRPWRSTGIPPQKSTIFLCTNGAQHRIWHLADLIPQHRNIALILSSLIPNTRPPSADPESRRVPPKTALTTTQDSHRDCISHHHRQHHSFALIFPLASNECMTGGVDVYYISKKERRGIGRYFGGGTRPQCYRRFTGCVWGM